MNVSIGEKKKAIERGWNGSSDESFVASESRKGDNRETLRKVHLRQLFDVLLSFGDNAMAPCGEFRRRNERG